MSWVKVHPIRRRARVAPLLVAIPLLAACCAATYVAGTWNGRRSTESLPLDEAVRLIKDSTAPIERRRSAAKHLGRIGELSVVALQHLRDGGPTPLPQDADHYLALIRERLEK